MKALTIHQPWAWAIVAGHKTIENRSWQTSYRGQIAIHAGKSLNWLPDGCEFLHEQGIIGSPYLPETTVWARKNIRTGAVIATAELYDIKPVAELAGDPWASGPYCWMLRNVVEIVPVACRGAQGLFELPADIAEAVELAAIVEGL